MAVPTHAIVGRERELAFFDRAARAASSGAFACVALTGEPGIGKTFLLREACRRCGAAGFTVVEGRGTEFETAVPFGLALDALNGLLGGIEQALLRAELPAERYRGHQAVRAALETLARDGPLLLALDDVHRADEASLELVAHLLRHNPSGPILMVLTYRGGGAPRRLLAAVTDAERDGSGAAIELGPLAEDDALALLPPGTDDDARRRLYTDSGGNPFYLTELGRAAQLGGEDDVPASVQAAVAEEIEQAPAGTGELLRVAAALDDPFELGLAARVADSSEADALAALDEIASLDIVRPAGEPGTWAFRHPVVRRAAYWATSPRVRLATHARAAVELERAGAPLSARAPHVARTAAPGDEDAVELLAAAAQAVASQAPTAAARWFGAAIRLLPEGAPPERRLGLLIPLAEARGTAGQLREGRATLTDALALLPPGQNELRARAIGAIARLDHMAGRHGDARRLLTQALAGAASERPAEALTLRLELAMESWLSADWHELVEVATRAAEVADELDDRLQYATAHSLLALGQSCTGAIGLSRESATRAARVIDALPDGEVAARVEALATLGSAEVGLERYDDSVRHIERGIAICHATEQSSWLTLMHCVLCTATVPLGRLGEAAAAADAATESARRTHDPPLIWALALRSWVSCLQGDLTAARREAEEAVAIADRPPPVIFSWLAHGMLAMAEVESGHAAAGRDRLLTHAGGPDLRAIEPSWRPRWYELLCAAELRLGDPDAAQAWADRALAVAAPLELDSRLAEALSARAAVALQRGNARIAAEAAHEAAKRFATVGRRVEAARASIVEARALVELGSRDDAATLLERSYSELDACGAAGYRDEAARELHELGRPTPVSRRRSAGNELEALTARERQIADLVADGRRNREIAEELFVSTKTVEKDLTRVFRKLGISTRAAVAGALERARSSAAND